MSINKPKKFILTSHDSSIENIKAKKWRNLKDTILTRTNEFTEDDIGFPIGQRSPIIGQECVPEGETWVVKYHILWEVSSSPPCYLELIPLRPPIILNEHNILVIKDIDTGG